MASILPIDNCTLNAVAVTAAEFISGSASYNETGQDIANTTADTKIHNTRQALSCESSFELYGDRTELNSAAGLATECILKYGIIVVATVNAIVNAVFNEGNNSTSVTIKCDPT